MTAIAIMGAGGKMGYRLSRNLKGHGHDMRYVEVSPAGQERMKELGISASPQEVALKGAEVVILAVPDTLIGKISHAISPLLAGGTMVMALDPAAPFAGELPKRDDLSYFVTHPCHPPIINDETEADAKKDFFGGLAAKQSIVCALMQGPEAHYANGEAIARQMYAPILRAHRVTVEQMAILEPALSETMAITFISMMREGMEEAIRRGVPREAAFDFLMGHINIGMAICFEQLPGAVFSDAAQKAIANARTRIFKPDWLGVFEKGEISESIQRITR
jgi:D-apionate oxidoisomerase